MGLVEQQLMAQNGSGEAPTGGLPAPAAPAVSVEQGGGATTTELSGMDPATAAVANMLKEAMSSPEAQHGILQQLQEGAKDLEMAVAILAANLLRSASKTAQGLQRQIPHKVLGRLATLVVGKLLEMAKAAQLLGTDVNPKALAMRALALTVYLYENGNGSVQ